ncbi:hypothetical protein GCM10010295_22860 [Streptomyces intermedius]
MSGEAPGAPATFGGVTGSAQTPAPSSAPPPALTLRPAARAELPAVLALLAREGEAVDKRRVDAYRFYAGLGFTPSHEGSELTLPRTTPAKD